MHSFGKKVVSTLVCVLAISTLAAPYALHADTHEVSVTPVVVDEKAKVRDILKESITIVNTSNRKLSLYPSVNNVSPAEGEQGFKVAADASEAADSLANWIELSRGVIELGPGEERTVAFTIRVEQSAVPGLYHALVSFGEGSTRSDAEAKSSLATVTVNVEVQADVKEAMQLNKFTTDNVVFTGDDVLFNYQLQNIGNQELQPKGEIRIYNRRGEEVASVDVNKDSKVVSPDQVAQLASVWSAVSGFGQYKALLTVEYGKSQTASVQDAVYFWVIPWKQLLGFSVATLVIVIILALYFHRWLEERHLGKLAHAGLLKAEAMVHLHTPESSHVPTPPPAPPAPKALPIPPITPTGSTINLKHVTTSGLEAKPTEAHIIDLKKHNGTQ